MLIVQPVCARTASADTHSGINSLLALKARNRPLHRLRVEVVNQAALHLLAFSGASSR